MVEQVATNSRQAADYDNFKPPRPEEEIADATTWRIAIIKENLFEVMYEKQTILLSYKDGDIIGFPKKSSSLSDEVKTDIKAEVSFLVQQGLLKESNYSTKKVL